MSQHSKPLNYRQAILVFLYQMVVLLGLEPRLGTNLVRLVYKTSDANITS